MTTVNKPDSKKFTLDRLALFVAAILVALALNTVSWLTRIHHIDPRWWMGTFCALIFFLAVGWGYRSKFRGPRFILFFAAWTVMHVLVFLWAMQKLGVLGYLVIAAPELWIGYQIAIWLFGPPPDKPLK